jgi:protein-tyrosine phosphatase
LPAFNDPKPFDVVVSLNSYALPVGWLVKELRFGFADGPLNPQIIEEIEHVAEWAYIQWKKEQRVLVRCEAGLNRSGLVNGLILMKDGMSAEKAIALIRKRRSPYALSNAEFEKYLLEHG